MKTKTMTFCLQAKTEAPDEADLLIYDEIGEEAYWGETYGFGPKKLTEELSKCDASTVNVRISSEGGDVFAGVAIHNILKGCGKKIRVTVDGLAASAASVIAMAGDTISMYPSSMMMIHNCWTVARGDSKELRKIADDMDSIMESVKQVYLDRCAGKIDAAGLDKMLEAAEYLTADNCLELGLCDEIIGRAAAAKDEAVVPKMEAPLPAEQETNFEPALKTRCWFF